MKVGREDLCDLLGNRVKEEWQIAADFLLHSSRLTWGLVPKSSREGMTLP